MHAILLLSLVAADAEPAIVPRGAPPRIVYLQAGGKILHFVTKAVPVTKEVAVTKVVDGKEVVEKRNVTVYETRTEQYVAPLGKAAYSTVGGKKLDAEAARKALESAQVVVISADGRPVDPGYLKVFKGDTLVVVPEVVAPPIVPAVRPGVRPVPALPGRARPLPAPIPPVPAPPAVPDR